MKNLQERINKIQRALQSQSQATIVLGLIMGNLPKNIQEKDLGSIDSYTEEYQPTSIKDHAYGGMKQIRISWQAAKNLQYGAGILAHEFGHIVSYELGLTPLAIAKVCTANRHQLSNSLYDKAVPLFQAEEDWADVFSAAVVSSLAAEGTLQPLNMACLLVGWDGESRGYSTLSLHNSFQGDEHSSGFYRLIQTQIDMKQTLPKSCMQALGLPENSDFFKACF